MSKSKVPVQKGEINPNQRTSKPVYREREVQKSIENGSMIRDAQTLKLHTPKQ